ncbi:TPA: hypothetical protein ACHVH6_001731, partial [Streptococcus suis]
LLFYQIVAELQAFSIVFYFIHFLQGLLASLITFFIIPFQPITQLKIPHFRRNIDVTIATRCHKYETTTTDLSPFSHPTTP